MPVATRSSSGLVRSVGATAQPFESESPGGAAPQSADLIDFQGASAQLSEPKFEPPEGDPLDVALLDMDDDAPVQGKDVKLLRDVTSSAITQVWSDSCAPSAC
ncbi:unnamed protein product [Nippostrongylus brasiliensis]|uniref:Secreted protein n=1 Tax=Nippostrongylus brasiliensis TaxID=27835 RepID=A0A0N4XLV0_NIPBR|nr:unnamed protein product [Nippostrongylus brasiliensis]